jgi:hypothetical protein
MRSTPALALVAGAPVRRRRSKRVTAIAARVTVTTTRQLLAKLLDRDTRFVFYPMADGNERWYEMTVTPSLDKLLGAVPTLRKAVASPRGTGVPLEWVTRQSATHARRLC